MNNKNVFSRYRPRWAFVFISVLLGLFMLLAGLQYRWIGQLSEAERERMQNAVRVATNRFAEEFNGEVMRVLLPLLFFQGPQSPTSPASHGELYIQWRAISPYPQIVSNVFLIETPEQGTFRLSRLNTRSRVLEPIEWPDRLLEVRARLVQKSDEIALELEWPFRDRPFNFFLPGEPTIVAPLIPRSMGTERISSNRVSEVRPMFPRPDKWAVIEFNKDAIIKEVLPDLTERYFSNLGSGEYRLAVATQTEPRQIIYSSNEPVSLEDFSKGTDARAALFANGPNRLALGNNPNAVLRPAERRLGSVKLATASPNGHWELLVQHRLGSVDAAVTKLRYRNLAISFGILLVLVAGIVMVIIASERARVLAKLQMEFAAGVSHELRSPLSVIQALASNLASGIVKDPTHVEQYAEMVRHESRGLSRMVDQVLLFAEAGSSQKEYQVGPVEVVEIIDSALAGLTSEICENRCEIVMDIPDNLPTVRGNAAPLTHCLRNLLSNAVKYGRDSMNVCAVTVAARRIVERREVQISVVDAGAGIDPNDLPHIFEPFYRGSNVSPGIRGTGLGLYLAKYLIDALGGGITVRSRLGVGTEFILYIPEFTDGSPAAFS